MTTSSRLSGWLALLTLVVATPGCWTGVLIESGRLNERVTEFDRFEVEGEELLLGYTVDVSRTPWGAKSRTVASEPRTAVLRLDELYIDPPHRPDAFPLEHVTPGETLAAPLPFGITNDSGDIRTRGAPDPTTDARLRAEIELSDGRHHGFRICANDQKRTSADGPIIDDAKSIENGCSSFFYSAALFDHEFAWWIYPAAPLTLIVDIALIPLQVLTLPPMLMYSD